MANLYVDPAATGGSDNGTSWTDAWLSIQSAIDYGSLAAGDNIYMRGTETPSVQIDWDGLSGTAADRINFIGCNASGVVDGTRYILDFGTNAIDGCVWNNMDYLSLQNIRITSSYTGGTVHGMKYITSNSSYINHVNLMIDSWSGDAINGSYCYQSFWNRCLAVGNGGYGFRSNSNGHKYSYCSAFDNGNTGFVVNAFGLCVGCLSVRNGSYGYDFGSFAHAYQCVAHDNDGSGMFLGGTVNELHGCRLTLNGGYGVELNGFVSPVLTHCYFQSNTSGAAESGYTEMNIDGTGSHNEFSGSDTNYGYVDPDNDNYNLAKNATLRNIFISLGV